ncbi:MAG TPA: nuclear transport factor 2 family protein [Steroidobacteraceae bacterium]|jgi:ketosteroid isomerase-like protein
MPYANASDSGSPDRAAAERAVDNALKSLSEGYRTLNPRLLTSPAVYYSDDSSPSRYVLFDVMPPFVDVGFNTLLEKNTKYVDIIDGPIVVSWTDTYVDGDSGFAYFRGIMHAKASYKDGRKLDIALRHTLVFKKIDGKFLIVHEHASVPDAAIGIETPSKQ